MSFGTSEHGPGCACTRCRGFEPGNIVALKHGANSERRIRPLARAHRRRVLRQLRLSPRDLDAIGRGYLDSYVRLHSKVEAIDEYLAEHEIIREDGEPQPVMKVYVALSNSARLALVRLEGHLRDRQLGGDPLDVLEGVGREVLARRTNAEQA